ncbi:MULTISPECIES: hypothetical protein [Methylobacterium]|jgi:hypothetical protein|uniref:hypothetical protein n=1 Tax=Methylobacterium TaxID=407 RepID=UPI0019E764AD|nr:hypothetical protein [Methylobacterium organophilum]MBE7196349.1 hypothetical protein [Parafilimonas terrae]UMY19450.1 hypothetical protein MMB17_09200 [Methylobacterium organophilum]
MPKIVRAVLAAALVASAGPALAADHTNLEEGLPITVEDAYPIKENGLEVQSYFQYNRTRNDPRGLSSLMAVPRVEWGAFKNFQLSVEAPYRVGTASDTDQGAFRAQGFYNFNQEDLVLPALAVALGVNTPYGRMAGGTETELKFLATKSIGTPDPEGLSPYSYVPRRIHFNASWFHNYDPTTGREAERRDRYRVGVGYSQLVSNNVVLVADIFRETDRERGRAVNLAEIGARYIVTPQTVLTGGVGVGFGGDRRQDFRVTAGLQHSLSFPYSFDPPR